MHDLLLDDTTNVASMPQFADRKTTKVVDGKSMTGYFVSDFLYSELQELRLKQRLAIRTKIYDNYFTIPSFDQIMSLAQSNYNTTKRTVGIYVELKHPSFFKSLGFNMEDMFLDSLAKGGYEVTGDDVPNNLHQVLPVVIQCFDESSLKYMREKTSIPLIQLYEDQPNGFYNETTYKHVASYANGIGPNKADFGSVSYEDGLSMMTLAHSYNLYVHPWTFRADTDILSKFHNDFFKEEMYFYCCLGMDGLFSEFPDRSRETIDVMNNYTAWNDQAITKKDVATKICVISCTSP